MGHRLVEATNNIRSLAVFAKRFMPDDVEEPMIYRMNVSQIPILVLGVTYSKGDIQEHSLLVEDRISNEPARVDGVPFMILFNPRSTQVLVEVTAKRLKAHRLSLKTVAQAVQARNLTLPAGNPDIGRARFTVRVPGEFDNFEDIRDVVVGRSSTTFAPVHVRDIAEVSVGLEDEVGIGTLNGTPMLMMMLQRESGTDTVEAAKRALTRIERLNKELPAGFNVNVVMDMSENVVLMIDALTQAVYGGAILVVIVVVFLRRLRTSLVAVISFPLSLIGVFATPQPEALPST